MRIPVLLLALAGLGVSAAAAAAERSASDKPQLICRSGQKSTGSHMRKPRKCMTAEQWQEADEAASRAPITMRVVAASSEGKQRAQ